MLAKSCYYLLQMTMFESFFLYDRKFHEQCDGIAMGSAVEPSSSKVFMICLENIW